MKQRHCTRIESLARFEAVLDARHGYPMRGEAKIAATFQSQGWSAFESMIGRTVRLISRADISFKWAFMR